MNDPHDRTHPAESIDGSPVSNHNGSADHGEGQGGPSDTIEQPDNDATQIASVPGQFDTPGVVVSAFEQLLVAGKRPAIEDFLARLDDTFRQEVFSILLRKEFESRMQSGDRPDLKDMRARFPQYALQIALTHKAVKAEHARVETERTSESASEPTDDEATLGEATEIESSPPQSSGTSIASPASGSVRSADESMLVDGRYEKQTVLGAGGMGAIWTAFDSRTRRTVAFKEIKTDKVTHQQYVSRFVNEAQITAQLEHPGIVPVHDVGWQPDGSPYYVMQLVSDETLARRIRKFHKLKVGHADRNLESTRLLREFINVCYSLDYAHDRGIIHRDLKPQNVMIGQHGETVIIDWGLAKPFRRNRPANGQIKRQSTAAAQSTGEVAAPVPCESVDLESYGPDKIPTLVVPDSSNSDTEPFDPIEREHATPTIDGAVMGTLDYMAPEQAQGRLDSLDHRADIFALGAILFEILTGEAWPRGRMTTPEKIVYVADGIVPLARDVNEDVPRPLEAICNKALQQEIEDRYGSARELIDDLECWLADKPVSVYADSWTTRCRRWVSRNRSLVTGLIVALVVSVVLIVSGLWWWSHIESTRIADSRNHADRLDRQAQALLDRHEFELASTRLAEAVGAVEDNPTLQGLAERLRSKVNAFVKLQREDLRIHALTEDVSEALALSEGAGSDPNRRHQAAERLSELRTEMSSELQLLEREQLRNDPMKRSALTHWLGELRPCVGLLGQAIKENGLHAEAIDTLQDFQTRFDAVRYHGMSFPEGTRSDAARETRDQAARLLRFLGRMVTENLPVKPASTVEAQLVEGPASGNVGAARDVAQQLMSPTDMVGSRLLSRLDFQQQESLRIALFELLVRLSDAEAMSGADGTTTEQATCAEKALDWLGVARELKEPSRAVLERELRYLSLLGRNEESERVQSDLEKTVPQSSLDLFLLAETDRHSGRHESAEQLYRQAAEGDPENLQARYFCGWCGLILKRAGAALADFSQCIEQQPDFAVTYVARSQTWLQLGEFGKALADCDQALALDQNLFPAWMARGVVLSEQQRHEDALACFDRSVELRPLAAVPMTNRGEAKRQIGIAILQERDPAKNQIAADYFVDAIRDFTRVLERRPLNTRAYLFRVQTRAAMGQTEQALRELQQGIVQRGEPRFVVECYRDIGLIQLASGEFQAALWSFERALKITTDNPEVPIPKQKLLLLKNETLKHLSSREDLLASLSRYLEIDQTLGEVFWERGLVQQRLGLFAEAMQDFTRLLDADSNHRALALTRRGWMYLMHANRFAEQDFDNAIALQPENPDLYNGRGFARAMNGKYVEAIADAERAVKLIRPEQAKLRVKVAVWALYFNAATIYGQAVSRVENDSTRSDAERTERREAYTSRAIALLDLARESADSKLHGRIAQAIKREPSFESIRDTDAFGEMVKRLSVP